MEVLEDFVHLMVLLQVEGVQQNQFSLSLSTNYTVTVGAGVAVSYWRRKWFDKEIDSVFATITSTRWRWRSKTNLWQLLVVVLEEGLEESSCISVAGTANQGFAGGNASSSGGRWWWRRWRSSAAGVMQWRKRWKVERISCFNNWSSVHTQVVEEVEQELMVETAGTGGTVVEER